MALGSDGAILWAKSSGDKQVFGDLELEIVSEVRETGEQSRPPRHDGLSSLVYINFLRVALSVPVMLMVHYPITLTRFRFRLAAFYDARRDAILLTPTNAFPARTNIGELERMMNAIEPAGVDFGRPPKTTMDHAMQLAQMIVRNGRRLSD